MASILPEELFLTLSNQIPCRALQIRQALSLLSPTFPSPSTIVLHGVEATGKSLTINAILDGIDTPSAVIRSQECITTRHLLERTIAGVKEALAVHGQFEDTTSLGGRCESISAFFVELQELLAGKEKFILVFDGIDRQREAAPTLLPAIARLGETLSNLTTILIATTLQPHLLHHASIPHIHFPPYTRAETLSILSRTPLYARPPSSQSLHTTIDLNAEDTEWLWARFTAAVWDSLGQPAARSIPNFRDVCARLWPPFIQPILDGHYGAREFSKLLVKNRSLFQSEDALTDNIVPTSTFSTTTTKPKKQPPYTLPYHPSHLLISAYLASHNPPKHDITLFSQTSLSKRRKRGGGTALTPHRASNNNSRHRTISRKLLGPQPFPLERLLAIYHAILPLASTSAGGGGGADTMCQVATLVGLRLVVKAGGGGGGDALEGGGGKWRVNVGWEVVRGVARRVGFDVESYLIE